MTKEERTNYKQREMQDIYDSLAWKLKERLGQADSIVRTMFVEMSVSGVPHHMAQPFLQEKLMELIAQIRDETERAKTG